MNLPERFRQHARIDESGCWEWTGSLNNSGYGTWSNSMAHRFAYECLREPIPSDREIDHLCRNKRCVNPDHMEVVTRRENVLRSDNFAAIHARKTHCVRGHKFDAANTYHRPDGKGGRKRLRECKECRRLLVQPFNARKKAARAARRREREA